MRRATVTASGATRAATTRFVVLAAPRTGSNLLCTLLNSHPEILCHHELFNPRGIFVAVDRRDGSLDLGTVTERDRDPAAFLERVWREPGGARCVGFKMTRGQEGAVMDRVLCDPAMRTIVVRRRNRLATFVSYRVAEETDQWEVYDAEDLSPEAPVVRVALEALRAHTAADDAFYAGLRRSLAASGQPHVQVDYEDLLRGEAQRRLLRFLGVPAGGAPLRAASVKQRRRSLRSVIAGVDEVERVLRGSEFEGELDDERA